MDVAQKCLICNAFVLEENAVSLSKENSKQSHRDVVNSIITQIVTQHPNGAVLSSDAVCKDCFSTCTQVYETECKLKQQKQLLLQRFKDAKATQKGTEVPSSDEDAPQDYKPTPEDKKLKTMEEIEEELVKMHASTDIATDVATDDDEDDEIQLLQSDSNVNNVKIEGTDSSEQNFSEKGQLKRTFDVLKTTSDSADNSKQIKLAPNDMVTRVDNLYTCMLCEGEHTVCGEARAIMAHIKEAHDARLYICDVCSDLFRKRTELSAHMDEHVAAEEGDFQCEVCHRIYSNLRLFRIHRRVHQPQNKAWTCDQCGRKFNSRNLLDEHVNTHTGHRPYVCATCGKTFTSKYTFRAHEKTHESRERPHKCSVCPKVFLTAANVQQHERTHASVKGFGCHLCVKRFSSAHNLEVHSIVHTGYKPYVCGICSKAFARRAEIRDHERTHTGEKPYQCEMCGASFCQRSNLQTHVRSIHLDEKRYQCNTCGKAFKRRRLLDYHVQAAHTGERPLKCDMCDATFVYPEHFKKHRRIHSGEKPYLCEVCGKGFASRDNRNSHRFVHSDKKPYECIVCAAGFMRKPLLYQHMQNEGHVNDTIVVNQPQLPTATTQDCSFLALNEEGLLEVTGRKVSRMQSDLEDIAEEDDVEHKLFVMGKPEETTFILGEATNETIIIDGQEFHLKGEAQEHVEDDVEEHEETLVTTTEFEGILTSEAIASGQTQIVQTKDGPVQLLAVRIPNDDGEEEEAWIKILPEPEPETEEAAD